MAPTVYVTHVSPPVRAVLITAKAIGLAVAEKEVNLFAGEHLKPEYLKLNPQHTVPTLVDDDGFTIWDSHAIITYLVSKYAKNDALYPKDLKKRAVVDQRLHFESGFVTPRLKAVVLPVYLEGKKTITQQDKERICEAYAFLETFLNGHQWVAGDFISVADYSLVSIISSLHYILVPIDAEKYPNLQAWLKRMEGRPEYEANVKGLEDYRQLLKSKMTNLPC
ncbi:Glutathione S-transferase D2-like Protein [Tribolium castaneum]|uniref:Glutathione S-transferase D2-like Protein n=1 Tax=Tribolium castaneum TaxID=7070 RepID=D6WCV7_TRICA|nr:PREDICTED: glutathione S-transferase 1 isoform X1 [Tribolium castaneum]EEZ98835.1 Glutathione S-transferase D2-like Protein [Tribolium castaneum]|eukprot:XP_967234.1 PREDICTED: glutathione S-transferase 1 isoform X1 [Tribolium castaneum]